MIKATPLTIATLCSDGIMDTAYAQVCQQWKDKGDNHGVWSLRFHWAQRKWQLKSLLMEGRYRFSPCRAVKINQHSIGLWNAEDTLILKMLTLMLGNSILPTLSPQCTHIKGNGGLKHAVMQAKNASADKRFVLKSDVKSYYASMKHSLIIKQFKRYVQDDLIIDLLWQFLTHLDDLDGELFPCNKGIGKGSSLSPLIAALYLDSLDQVLGDYAKQIGGVYIRYVDDWLLLCNTRWHLRKAVKKMNSALNRLGMFKAEKKTFIGKIDKGYDWLGYRIDPDKNATGEGNKGTTQPHTLSDQTPASHRLINEGRASKQANEVVIDKPTTFANARTYTLTMNQTCIQNHLNTYHRLYEQGASSDVLAKYVKRWWIWANGGVELDGKTQRIEYAISG